MTFAFVFDAGPFRVRKYESVVIGLGTRDTIPKEVSRHQGHDTKGGILFADHVTRVCEAHNRVIVSFLQQVQGGTKPTTEGSRKNIGHNVHV